MRLESIELLRFGEFVDQPPITGFGPGLNVICASNEAGKSTLLGALRFGFYGTAADQYRVQDGTRRVTLGLWRDDRSWILQRSDARSRTAFQLRSGDGAQAVLQPEFKGTWLGGLSLATYQSIYALSLDELLWQRDLRDLVLLAESGRLGVALRDAERAMAKAEEELFSVGAAMRPLNRAVTDWQTARQKVRQLSQQPAEYDALQRRLSETEESANGLSEDLEDARRALQQTQSIQAALPGWNELAGLRRRCDELASVAEFPPTVPGEYQAAKQKAEAASAEAKSQEESWAAACEALERLEVDGAMLAHAGEIERLRDRALQLGQWPAQLADALREAQLERQAAEREARESCGQDVTADTLAALDVSVLVRNQLDAHDQTLAAVRHGHQQSEEAFKREDLIHARAVTELKKGEATLAGLPEPADRELLDQRGAVLDQQQPLIERLRDRALQLAQWPTQLNDARQTAQQERQAAAGEARESCGEGATSADLAGLDASVPVRSQLDAHDQALAAARHGQAQAEEAFKREDQTHARAAALLAKAEAVVAGLPEPADTQALSQKRAVLDQQQGLRDRWQQVVSRRDGQRQRLADLKAQRQREDEAARQTEATKRENEKRLRMAQTGESPQPQVGRVALLVAAVVLLAYAIYAFLQQQALAGAVTAITGISVLVTALLRTASSLALPQIQLQMPSLVTVTNEALAQAETDAKEAEAAVGAVDQELAALAPLVGLPPGASAEDWRQARERWEADQELCRQQTAERQHATTLLEEAKQALAETAKARELCEQALKAARRGLEDALVAWTDWLAQRGLPSGLTPEASRLWLETARHVKQRLLTAEQSELAATARQQELVGFRQQAIALAEQLGQSVSGDDCWALASASRWAEDARKCRQALGAEEELCRLQTADRQHSAEQLQAAKQTLVEAADSRQLCERALEAARRSLDEALAAWAAWLEQRSLPAGLAPDAARLWLDTARQVKQRHTAAEQSEATAAARQQDLEAFRQQAHTLAEALGRPVDDDDAWLLAAAGAWAKLLDQARGIESQRLEWLQRREAAEAAVAKASSELGQAAAAMTNALQRAQAVDEDDLVRRQGLAAELREVLQEQREVEARLRGALDDLAWAEWQDALLASDPAELPGTMQSLQERANELAEVLKGKRDDAAVLRENLARLETEGDLAGALLVQEQAGADIARLAEEWSAYRVAHVLLELTLRSYEAERQPERVARIGELFRQLTAGRWENVVARDGELVAIRDGGAVERTSETLSRGAREALFLCARLAALERELEQCRLPVAFDDTLVNLDRGRRQGMLSMVAGLAEQTQVLLFTCHDFVPEQLTDLGVDFCLVPLAEQPWPCSAAAGS